MANEVVRTVRVRYSADGQDELVYGLNRVKDAIAGVEQVAKSSERVDPLKSVQSLDRRLFPAAESMRKFAKEVETAARELDRAGEAGLGDFERRIAAIQRRLQDVGLKQAAGFQNVDPNVLLGRTTGGGDSNAQTMLAAIDRAEEQLERRREARDHARQQRMQWLAREAERLAEQSQASINRLFNIGDGGLDPHQQSSMLAALSRQADEFEQKAAQAAVARQARQDQYWSDFNRRMGIGGESATRFGASGSLMAEMAAAEDAENRRLQQRRTELLQRADPVGSAQERQNQALADAKRLVDAKRISEEQYLAILRAEQTILDNIHRDFGAGKGGFRASQRTNLGYQGYDILQGVLGGMPLSMIATQQGPQIAQILGDAPGGIKGGIKALASDLMGLVTPGRLAFGVIAAGAAVAAYALQRASNEANEFNRALRVGEGRRSGMSAGDVESLSRGVPGLSENEARRTLLGYASTGANRQNASTALGLTKGLANVMYDGDTEAAQKGLASAMRGGTDSLMKYVDSIRPLSPVTSDWIESIRATKGEQAANAELLKILNDGIKSVGIETPLWRQALTKLGNAASDLADAFLKEAGARANTTGQEASGILGFFGRAVPGGPSSVDARAGRPQAVVGGARGPMSQRSNGLNIPLPPDATQAIESSIAELEAQEARGTAGAKSAVGLNQRYNSDATALRKLNLDLSEYNRLLADSEVRSKMSAEEIKAAEEAQRRLQNATSTFLTQEQRSAEQHGITTRAIMANNVAQEAAAAAAQKNLDLKGKEISESERLTQALRAEEDVRNRALKAAQDSLRNTEYQSRSAGMLPFQKSVTDLRAQLEEALRRNEGASPEAIAAIRRDYAIRAQTMTKEAVQGPINSTTTSINEQISSLKVQRDSFLASTSAAAEMAAKQDLINQYMRQGIEPNAEMLKSIDALAKKMGEFAKASEDFNREKQNVIGGMDELRQGTTSLFTGILSDVRQGKNPLQGIVNSLGRMSDQFVERVIFKPFVESMFGFMGKPGGGMFGDGLSKIFGNPQAVPIPSLLPQQLMTINAATVIINSANVQSGIGAALGTNPTTGSPIQGAGSGMLGFGLGGPQSSGSAAALGSGLSTFGFGPNGQRIGGAVLGANAESVYRGLVARGFTPVQAAAAVGNIKHESGFSTTVEGDKGAPGGSSFGLMQWREGRLENLKALAASQGKDWRDREVQLDFIAQEARGGDAQFGSWFRRTKDSTDVGSAAESFAREVERPRADALAKSLRDRQGGAFDAYRQFGTGGPRAEVPAEIKTTTAALEQSTETATKSVTDLSQSVAQIPDAASSATNSLSSFASSLFNFKPDSGGGGFNLASLFGGGGGSYSAGETVSFAGGGFTGIGGRYDPAGVVHRGEYVFSAPSVSRIGLHRLDRMHRGYANGGLVAPSDIPPNTMPPTNDNSYTDARSISVDARGSTMDESRWRAILHETLRKHDANLDRTLPTRMASAQKRYR